MPCHGTQGGSEVQLFPGQEKTYRAPMKHRDLVLTLACVFGALPSCSKSSSDSTPAPDPTSVPSGMPDAALAPAAPPGPFGAAPKVTRTVHIEHLSGPVDVVRDKHGMVHIYATNENDAMRVQAYQMARDRTAQLELVRRNATGRLAEAFGDLSPGLIDSDIAARTIGLARVAKATYDALPAGGELRGWLDAFADGVSQFNARVRSGKEKLPDAMTILPLTAFEPWTGVDVLAVGRLQSQSLAYTAPDEIAQTEFVAAARAAFPAGSADPAVTKRAGLLVDLLRFAPLDPTLAMDGFPNDVAHLAHTHHGVVPERKPMPAGRTIGQSTPQIPLALLERTRGFRAAAAQMQSPFGERGQVGSNNWVVGPSRTATGHAMVASDPHLTLSAPSVFWMMHMNITAQDATQNLDFAGLAFAGIPGIILGFNANVAWGATVSNYDVTDVYRETLTPDGTAVVFKGQNVPLEKVREIIGIKGSAPLAYDVLVVPHHGPIVPTIKDHVVVAPDPALGAMSIRWTGSQPTGELKAVAGFMRAKTVEDARVAVKDFEVGSQNWVFGDTAGAIFYTSQSRVPTRDKAAYTWNPATFEGQLPCFVLPGDGTAEWTGALDEAFVPHIKNPPKAYVGTANGDQVGVTLDNDPSNDTLPNGDPVYLGCWQDPGFRVGRIHDRIEKIGHPMTLDDMSTIQADARSAKGAYLAPKLLTAMAHAEEERAQSGTHKDLTAVVQSARYQAAKVADLKDLLTRWGTESDYLAAAGVNLEDGSPSSDAAETAASKATLVFNMWMVRMIGATLDDELTKIGNLAPDFDTPRWLMSLLLADPTKLATYDSATGDSALFDDLGTPDVVESRDERMITSLLDALDALTTRLGGDQTAWRWGSLHTLRFASLVSLWGSLSIPPVDDPVFPRGFPRHGDGYNIDVGSYNARPKSLETADFSYHHGPTQRFVIDLDPKGPVARNALPGGQVWDDKSPHFRDQADEWRKNQSHAIPFAHDDVARDAEERLLYTK